MPSKSRRSRHLSRSKRKGRKRLAPVAQAPAVRQAQEPTPVAEKPTPPPQAPKPKAPVAAQASNVSAELLRIGILGGIVVVILVILALIFA